MLLSQHRSILSLPSSRLPSTVCCEAAVRLLANPEITPDLLTNVITMGVETRCQIPAVRDGAAQSIRRVASTTSKRH